MTDWIVWEGLRCYSSSRNSLDVSKPLQNWENWIWKSLELKGRGLM